ncbi:MAG: DUF1294 domain-containing protein [Firmicutes bacterium]|nr:DUF1294 domain-containing protein [Bacillota bacterium]MBQ6606664.1 DUF1294 domain-containing protein [Bacillota bacterium]MBR0179513.1 DUF1294 domain-containing protein [Bacillota bacterium]
MTLRCLIIGCILTSNIISFTVFGLDKLFAKGHRRRVPEATLLLLALLYGAAGELLAMILFRHKTLHKKFSWGLPLILLLQIGALVYFGLPQ